MDSTWSGPAMRDLLYLLGTIAFFAAMLAYVRGLRRLGRAPGPGDER